MATSQLDAISSKRLIEEEVEIQEKKKAAAIEKCEKIIRALNGLIPAVDLVPTDSIEDMIEKITDSSAAVSDDSGAAQVGEFTGTVLERTLQFFQSTYNKPASNAEIRHAIKANRGTLAMVIYNTHRSYFTKVPKPNTHIVYWKLTDAAFKASKGDAGDGDYVSSFSPENDDGSIPF